MCKFDTRTSCDSVTNYCMCDYQLCKTICVLTGHKSKDRKTRAAPRCDDDVGG